MEYECLTDVTPLVMRSPDDDHHEEEDEETDGHERPDGLDEEEHDDTPDHTQ